MLLLFGGKRVEIVYIYKIVVWLNDSEHEKCIRTDKPTRKAN